MLQITHQDRFALVLMADGKTSDEIARRLNIQECDIDSYLSRLCETMGVGSRSEAIAAASRRGLLIT